MAYSGFFVFGDSLVDAGNALALSRWYDSLPFAALPEGAPVPSLGYFAGRFSNGYTFADLLSNKAIGAVTKPVFPYAYEDPYIGARIAPFASDPNGNNLNFAYGGSHIIRGDEAVPDFDGQTDAFRDAVDGDADPNALYLITLGGNDVRDLALTGSETVPPSEAYPAMNKAADKMLHELIQLVEMGAHKFVIMGMADVGSIPRYDRDDNGVLDAVEQQRSDSATEYSIYLDTLIRTEVVPALRAAGADVTYVPIMDYVDENGQLVIGGLTANLPTIAALHGLTVEELTNNWLEHKELIFFDHVHPNAQANALLAAYAQAIVSDTPWIEVLPLMGADIDYRATGSIGARGEVDQLYVTLVAGTNYTLEMLGISSLATSGSLADCNLRLVGSGGVVIGADDDSGAGFDSTLTFSVATTGTYRLQLSAIGAVTGNYVVQGAVVDGAAMLAGNTYSVTRASTIVLEGVGGIGRDAVRATVSYTLSQGCEIEVLRTTNDAGTAAIDLTGNEFGQSIVGNAGANRLDGRGGADVFTGRGGPDTFILGREAVEGPGNIDRIVDYASEDVVDVGRLISVAAGTDIVAGGYVRVTTTGKVQVDLDGGGDDWVTLSTINAGGAVAIGYLSGGVETVASVGRVAESYGVTSAALMAEPAASAIMPMATAGDWRGLLADELRIWAERAAPVCGADGWLF